MKKNLYYKHVFGRTNVIKEFLYSLFLAISSWPRLLLEVFLRKNMGERYFSFSTCILIIVILCYLPFPITAFRGAMNVLNPTSANTQQINLNNYLQSMNGAHSPMQMPMQTGQSESGQHSDFFNIVITNITWYLFIAAFFIAALVRRKEIQNLPSVFDFERFSLSTGIINPVFYKVKLGGIKTDVRIISTIIEPAVFLVIGIILMQFHQLLGNLLATCAVIYSLSYFAAYHIGDNYIMDKIDEIICNEDLKESLIEGREPLNNKGVNFEPRIPDDPELKRRVYESFFDDDESSEAF